MTDDPSPARTRGRVVAVLGPTNTGKTHYAMERMLAHETGMIGFPLRLLARENYERAVKAKGPRAVALITGEEKIVPPDARYFLCTVEAMPTDRPTAFVGVDEIQMCADADRGHVFTDRLLDRRGVRETMFMGAETVRPVLRRLVPKAEVVSRPRFSTLSYAGSKKVSRLPPRSAIVAFTAADVYALAELIRRQRGGAAVVLGALSPRTRNAQVAMYQAGEVDYLVATDAIGMGLNMDVDHVAFAATRKFDGRFARRLTAPELAQIAGRAGRHMNDGTFGTTAEIGPLDAEVVERIESHRFDPLRFVYWRNAALDFSSLPALRASLQRPSRHRALARAREAEDEMALAALAGEPEIADKARTPDAVRLLWEVAQIPDFGKVMTDAHARQLGQIFRYLVGDDGGRGRLPTDWVARRVDRLERTEGDIEALVQRIAGIRTWTYVAFRGDWLDDARHWQERTRAIEDRLSDALHERLTQRFVDRETSKLIGRLKERRDLLAAVKADGEVVVEGHPVGAMDGFRFVTDGAGADGARRAVHAAARKALRGEVAARVRRVEDEPDDAFALADDGTVRWRGAAVAALAAGRDVLRPAVHVTAAELLEADHRERVRQRLAEWLAAFLAGRLEPLYRAEAAAVRGAARGLVFQVAESLGSVPRAGAAAQIDALSDDQRGLLREIGLRIGRESVFFPALLKPKAAALRGLLWAVHQRRPMPEMPPAGRMSVPADPDTPDAFYEAVGYRRLGPLAVRIDIVERLAARARRRARDGAFAAGAELMTLAGCGADEIAGVLGALGYRAEDGPEGLRFRAADRSRPARRKARIADDDASPFAKLRGIGSSR